MAPKTARIRRVIAEIKRIVGAFGLSLDAITVTAMFALHYSASRRKWRRKLAGILLSVRGRGGLVQVKPRGCKIPIWLRPGDVGDVQSLMEVFTREMYPRPGSAIVLDAGAHIGTFSRYALEIGNAKRVIAIEPDPDNVRLLRRNLSSFKNASVIQAALWSSDGRAQFFRGQSSNIGQVRTDGFSVAKRLSSNPLWVQTITPKSALLPPLAEVDFIKVDIEGAELGVLPVLLVGVKPGTKIVGELHSYTAELCLRNSRRGKIVMLERKGNTVLFEYSA